MVCSKWYFKVAILIFAASIELPLRQQSPQDDGCERFIFGLSLTGLNGPGPPCQRRAISSKYYRIEIVRGIVI